MKFKKLLHVLQSKTIVRVFMFNEVIDSKTVYDWLFELGNGKYHSLKVMELKPISDKAIDVYLI